MDHCASPLIFSTGSTTGYISNHLLSGLRFDANCLLGTVCCVANVYKVYCLNHVLRRWLIKLSGSVMLVHRGIRTFGAFILVSFQLHVHARYTHRRQKHMCKVIIMGAWLPIQVTQPVNFWSQQASSSTIHIPVSVISHCPPDILITLVTSSQNYGENIWALVLHWW